MIRFRGGSDMATRTKPSHLEYIKQYDRDNKITVTLRLNKVTEPELIEYWQSIPNKARWFKDHLRAEMARAGKQKAGK